MTPIICFVVTILVLFSRSRWDKKEVDNGKSMCNQGQDKGKSSGKNDGIKTYVTGQGVRKQLYYK